MANNKIKILNISSDKDIEELLEVSSTDGRYKVSTSDDINKVLKLFAKSSYDILIINSKVCRQSENEYIPVIKTISEKNPLTQIIFIADQKDLDMAASALKAGSYHYLKNPVDYRELKLMIDSALDDLPVAGDEIIEQSNNRANRFGEIIGGSEPMLTVYEQIKQAAISDISVLLLGETGTGKDLVAQTIHRLSKRTKNYFVPVNLGALPTELVASELFGHEKGAFTGAVDQRKGVFETAIDGTVFLDEIDTVDEKIQVSLLRLLDKKKFNRIGGKRVLSSNARIIVASNADIVELVNKGIFRKDLFFRFDVFRIQLPPLRERGEDILYIANEMIAKYTKKYNKNIQKVSPQIFEILESYNWPGNIRELKSVIQAAVLVCNESELQTKHLPQRMQGTEVKKRDVGFKVGTSLESVEKEMIIQALKAANNNRKKAAEMLGISRRALYNKFNKHNILKDGESQKTD